MRTFERASRARRLVGGIACLGAAAALTLTSTPAQATTALTGMVGADAGYSTSGGTCSGTGGSQAQTAFSSNGQSRTVSTSDDGTISNTGDATDNATWSASATTKIKASQTSTSSTVSFSTALQASVDADLGSSSACDPEASAQGIAQALLTVSQGGWLSVNATIPRGGQFGYSLVPATSIPIPVQVVDYNQGSYTGKVWVDPGAYELLVQAGSQTDVDPATKPPTSMHGTVKVTASVKPAGAAKGAASGSGKSYVSLPGAVTCLGGTVAVPFTAKAGGASSATFYVNGKKKATITNPQKGLAAVLKGVPAAADTTVKVVVKPKNGASATATRTYLACS